MARVFVFANQKGGVGKTTSNAAISAAFAEQGKRVLLVDLDPQAGLLQVSPLTLIPEEEQNASAYPLV